MKTMTQSPIAKLRPFADHPYKVLDNEEMDSLTESIRENGVLTPVLVRPLESTPGEYEIIAGHRRIHHVLDVFFGTSNQHSGSFLSVK